MNYTRDQIEETMKQKDYKYFLNGNFNLNIIGIRNSSTGSKVTNRFDDKITLSYKDNRSWNSLGRKHNEKRRSCCIKTRSI